MVDSSHAELLSEVREKYRRVRLHLWVLAICVTAAIASLIAGSATLGVITVVVCILLTPFAWRVDIRRKTVEISYHLDPGFNQQYGQLLKAFEVLRTCQGFWHVRSVSAVWNRKYHAGVSTIVERQATLPSFKLPPYFESNVCPAMLTAGPIKLFFFPDTILVFDSKSVGAIGYSQFLAQVTSGTFVENNAPPRDGRQIGQTWRFVNKDGGPDRRFNGNRMLPIMQYGTLKISSSSGLGEEFKFSKANAADNLVVAIIGMRQSAVSAVGVPGPVAATHRKPWPTI